MKPPVRAEQPHSRDGLKGPGTRRQRALGVELDRCRTTAPGQQEETRRQALLQLLNRCRDLPWPDQRSGDELQAELYDETGLPA